MSEPQDPIFHNNGDGELEEIHESSSDDDAMLTDDEHGSGSSIEEVADEDIANYFLEIGNRLYPSHPTAPYPLPVDTPENDRTKANHAILKRLIGANCHRPVNAVLALNQARPPRALDVCCGVGTWVKDMAADYPHAQFIGIDIVPLATRYPPDNVHFELCNVNSPLRWDDGHFSLIHARDVMLAVTDYGAFLNEAARVLQPGGLLLSVEWANRVSIHPTFPGSIEENAPVVVHFFDTVNQILSGLGVNSDGSLPSRLLSNSPHFTNVATEQIDVPIGPWNPNEGLRVIGSSFRAAHKKLAQAYKRMLLRAGMSPEEVDTLIHDFVHEMRAVDGLVMTVYLTSAERV